MENPRKFLNCFVFSGSLCIMYTILDSKPELLKKVVIRHRIYEVCPESIGPTFISPRHSVRATSAGHESQQ